MPDAELDGTPSEPSAATPTGAQAPGQGPQAAHGRQGAARHAARARAWSTGLGVAFLYRHLNGNLNVLDPSRPALPTGPDKVDVEGPQRAAQRPGDGLGLPRLRRLQHRRPDRRRRALGHHDPAPPLRGPAAAYGISIPRDSLVDRPDCKTEDGDTIPGGTSVMWNEAFALGGPACTIQQFEQITGIRLDHFVVVDFEQLPGHGRRHRRRRDVHPRGHRRPGARHHTSRPAPAS